MYESLNLSDLATVVLCLGAVVVGATVWLCRLLVHWTRRGLRSVAMRLRRQWRHRPVGLLPAPAPVAPPTEPRPITRIVSVSEPGRDWSAYRTPTYLRRGLVICA